jgi:hypothetical protein
MYRYLVILSVLIVSLSACGSNETPQVQHDASLSKALTATSVTATKESVNCPITNEECNSTPEECTTTAEKGCPKAGTLDCPKAVSQDCDKAGTPDCPEVTIQERPNVSGMVSIVATESSLDQAEAVVTEAAEVKSSLPTTSILTLSLQNEFGTVLVPHSQHVEMYSCEVCHPTTPPGKIEKTKKEFHALCRKCHVTEKAGPTKCRGCHQR